MVVYIVIDYILIKGYIFPYPRKFRMDYQYMIIDKVKELMTKEVEANPDLTDKEYEQLFVHHYLSLLDTLKVPSFKSKGNNRVSR